MRKLNVSMDMFGNTKGKEKHKKKEKKKEIGNVTMKYLSLCWQASICLAYLPTSSFILSFFLLFSLFWSKDLFFEILDIVDDIWGFHMNLDLKKKLKLRIIWKLP